MNNSKSAITILTCNEKGKKATKIFSKKADGTVERKSYNAGTFFNHETRPVSNLEELAEILENLSGEPRMLVIRGEIKANMPKVVQRKMHEPNAAFDPVARPYVMLDIDKHPCPNYFDPVINPEEIITWVQNSLPTPFRNVSCYYKFTSSQNVLIHEKSKKTVSLHLWYWCDKAILDEEWKRYFRSVPAPVDQRLFSPVQAHYTANPIFENMDNPLPKRSGFFKGNRGIVITPEIPKENVRKYVKRLEQQPIVNEESKCKGIELLVPHYIEGSRNRLCGAVAATLYRGGWNAENAADFIYQLAERSLDEEAQERHDNALRICDSIDQNLPAQGIPTLRDEFGIKNLDEILLVLGVGKPNIDLAMSKLNNQSGIPEIKEVLKLLLSFPKAERVFHLDKISKQTSYKKGSLRLLLQEVEAEGFEVSPQDHADELMEILLTMEYNQGHSLLYTADRSYWQYNGCIWQKIPEQHIKQVLLPYARALIADIEGGTVSTFNNSVMNILEGRVYREDDPLRDNNRELPSIINCLNGELWFDKEGNVTLKPHSPDSYLRYCLDVEYDPQATSPMFDKTVHEIFSNSSDPQDMFRHFMELAGYICQPWRKLAIIVLLHGGGSNGKTSLLQIIRRMLGSNTVMSDRIGDIEDNVFKIGDLDGKLMLLDDDVDGGTCLPDGFLKKISEEKAMTGQHKHKPPFEFICRAVPVMLANDYPVTKDLTTGLRRRLLVIPFNRTFKGSEMKVGLFDDIWEQEASGILNQTIAGFSRLKKRGRFHEPLDCINAKDEWIIRANILTTFIDDMCEEGENYREYLRDFYSAFQSYCHENSARNIPYKNTVRSRLEGLGYEIRKLNGEKAVWGLRLRRLDSSMIN